ncbi:MAG: pitrilysin family protein [Bryobacteraceae bacterium]|nr:pitrilysin family protein [Bryobacteraceae bacterium]
MRTLILLTAAATLAAQPQAAPRAPLPPIKSLKYPPLKAVKIPEVTQFTLANGMRVFLLENRNLPVVSGFALIRTGNLFDPKDKIGLADMTGDVMRMGGTKSKTGEQLNEQLENIAASVESSIGESFGRVGFNALKENTDEVLGAFKDVLTAPEFREDKVELARTQNKSGIARRNDDAGGIARREFSDIVYGKDSPYGWDVEYETLDRITRNDLVAFHKRYFFPKNTLLAVQGDFDIPAMRAKLETLFADWTVEQPPVPEFPKVDEKPRPGLYVAAKNDVNQSNFRLGHFGGKLNDKDYPALEVMSSILAGSPFSSRIGQAIRVRGYAYDIGGDWGAAYDHPGLFVIGGGTKSDNTFKAIRTVQQELEKFMSAPPTAAELQSAKDKILNTFVFQFDSPAKTLSRLVTYEYYGYPKDFIFQYQKAVEAVTPAEVQRVAKQYIKPENLTYVVVGKPADFGEPLTALNLPVTNIDLTIKQPKAVTAKADAASLAKGKALLDKTRGAMGGAKLTGLKDMTLLMDVKIDAGGGQLAAKQKIQWVAPATMRQENELPFGKILSFYDGKGGWIKTPQGEAALSGPMLRQVEEQAFYNLYSLVASGGASANYLGDGTVEIGNGADLVAKLTVDEATGMPQKLVYRATAGPPIEVEQRYLEFKDVDGVKVASRSETYQGGKKFADSALIEGKVNSGLNAEELSKKP